MTTAAFSCSVLGSRLYRLGV